MPVAAYELLDLLIALALWTEAAQAEPSNEDTENETEEPNPWTEPS